MNRERYWSRGFFGYGDKYPMTDTGQIIEVQGFPNDEKLVRLGHFREIPVGCKPAKCGRCGAEFISDGYLNRHGQLRHDMSEAKLAERLDMDSAFAEKFGKDLPPLNMDKTAAALAEGGGPEINTRRGRAGARA